MRSVGTFVSGERVQSRRTELVALMVAWIAALCFVWLAAKVTHGQTTALGETVRQWIHSISGPEVTRFFSAITFLGSQAIVIGVSACAAILMLSKRRPDRTLLVLTTLAGAEL